MKRSKKKKILSLTFIGVFIITWVLYNVFIFDRMQVFYGIKKKDSGLLKAQFYVLEHLSCYHLAKLCSLHRGPFVTPFDNEKKISFHCMKKMFYLLDSPLFQEAFCKSDFESVRSYITIPKTISFYDIRLSVESIVNNGCQTLGRYLTSLQFRDQKLVLTCGASFPPLPPPPRTCCFYSEKRRFERCSQE